MTQREIARLACKVLAVFFLVQELIPLQQSASQLSGIMASMSWGAGWGWTQFWYQLPTLIFPIIQILVAVWLWRRAGVVAAWMTGHDLQDDPNEPDVLPVPANLEAVQAVVLLSLGVWVLLSVIPEVVSVALSFAINFFASQKGAFEEAGRAVSNHIWIWFPQFGLGFWLIFGAPGIVALLRRFHAKPQLDSPATP